MKRTTRKQPVSPRRSPQADPRKRSVNLSADVLAELEAEARRQGRSQSWLAQQAWLIAKEKLRATPAPRLRDE